MDGITALDSIRRVSNVVHGLLHRRDSISVGVRDLDVELLLDGHHHLDGVETVEAEVRGEGSLRRHL